MGFIIITFIIIIIMKKVDEEQNESRRLAERIFNLLSELFIMTVSDR